MPPGSDWPPGILPGLVLHLAGISSGDKHTHTCTYVRERLWTIKWGDKFRDSYLAFISNRTKVIPIRT